VIEDVEDLPAELGFQSFSHWKILDQGSIKDIGSGRVEGVASAVANHTIPGIGKSIAQACAIRLAARGTA
jgi:hypothetical protein